MCVSYIVNAGLYSLISSVLYSLYLESFVYLKLNYTFGDWSEIDNFTELCVIG
jgi:hypothetical protein